MLGVPSILATVFMSTLGVLMTLANVLTRQVSLCYLLVLGEVGGILSTVCAFYRCHHYSILATVSLCPC